jgi:hypothetical protein
MGAAGMAFRAMRRGWVILALAVLCACGTPRTRPEIPRDRFGLAAHADVYVIHHTAARTFTIARKGDQGGAALFAPAVGIAALTNNYDAARLQQRFDLEDPALHIKARIVEGLRAELGLENLRVLPDASNLAALPGNKLDDMGDEVKDKPREGTFKDKYPTGAVIEVVTRYWGMHDYRIRYQATVRLVDLTTSSVRFSSHCRWAIEDPINAEKLFFDAGAGIGNNAYEQLRIYNERAENLLYAHNGALLKATLRKAADRCAATFVPRFLAPAPRRGAVE